MPSMSSENICLQTEQRNALRFKYTVSPIVIWRYGKDADCKDCKDAAAKEKIPVA